MTDANYEKVATDKSDAVMALLFAMCEGPREAYGILAVCIHRLNFEHCAEHAVGIDELCIEVAATLRSITPVRKSQ